MAVAPWPAPHRFQRMSADHAPGQEQSHVAQGLHHVDFSHGDVSAFPPPPEVIDAVTTALRDGGRYAYSPYRGHTFIRDLVAQRLGDFTGVPIDPSREVIVTPGTQGGLFLTLSALVERGDKVAVVAPDYFANRKIVEYLEATPIPVDLAYRTADDEPARLDLDRLRAAFQDGARLLVFSNPNNPTGAIYTADDIEAVARLAAEFDAFVVVDQLYSRQIFDQRPFTHLRAHARERCLTLIGPSKTESVSGCRVGVAVAPPEIIDRMEQLQGIVSLRAAGYMQAALEPWLAEAPGWLARRITEHARIRDDLHEVFSASTHLSTRRTEGGSYLFLDVPAAKGRIDDLVRRLRTEAAVTVTRGPEFGDFPESVRLNFSQDHRAAVDAAHRIVDVVARF